MHDRSPRHRDRRAIMRRLSLSRATDMLSGTGPSAGSYVRGCAAAFIARHGAGRSAR
jgi:hypothetical protein